MMWRCEDCGAVFEDPKLISYCKEDYNGVADLFGHQTWGTYDACPDCESEDIERISYCDINKCEDCPRMGDDCDGEYLEEDDIDEF